MTSKMYQFHGDGFCRLTQIIGNPKSDPPILPIIPVKKSCWWAGVKSGRFPKPIKLTPGVTVWRIEDIQKLIKSLSGSSS